MNGGGMKKEEDGIVSEIDHTDILLSGGSDKRRRQEEGRRKMGSGQRSIGLTCF
jgi:hypothetical protein